MNDREQEHNIIDTEATEALAVYEPPKPNEFSAELFSTYLVPNSFNDELDFSAYGLEHIAAELGYSITEQTILSETDTHCFMQAKGECVRTGRTSVATCRQPKQEKRHGKLVADENYIEKLSRRVNRNVLRQLIPVKLYKRLVEDAVKAGKAKENEIVGIRNDCTAAYIENSDTLGMSKKQCFAIAVATFGSCDFWNVSEWKTLRDALLDPSNFRKHFNGNETPKDSI